MATAKPPDSGSKSEKDILIVAAIDFGTTFTGFAYSFKSQPDAIYTSKWSGENVLTETEKAPTCVLLSPQKEFVAFGYNAQDRYSDLIDSQQDKDYYFFERFKLKLYHTKRLSKATKIADVHGKKILALDLISMVIRYLKSTLENEVANSAAGLQDDEILWVITIPAIWSDSAKQFMKEAAIKAGIASGCIKLVLEPEAGALYCNTKPLCRIAKYDGSYKFEELPVGQKYIVADIGGGTTDISIHEILPDRNLRELYCSHGDSYGGSMVDGEFLKFMDDVFGENVMKCIIKNSFDKYLELQAVFETKKRHFNTCSNMINFHFPMTEIKEIINKLKEDPIEAKVQTAKEKYGDDLKVKNDKMQIHPKIIETFFKKSCRGIIDLLKEVHEADGVREINTLLLVGGFSNSEYLRETIRSDFPGFRIIEAPEPSLAVLKGAVLFGYNPRSITERIARYSYGFADTRKFLEGKDPDDVKITVNGQAACREFNKIITKGETFKNNIVFFGKPTVIMCSKENPLRRISPVVIELYRSTKKNPKYIAEGYECELNGLMMLSPPETGWAEPSIILKGIGVFETELVAMAIDFITGVSVDGNFNFIPVRSSEMSRSSETTESSESES